MLNVASKNLDIREINAPTGVNTASNNLDKRKINATMGVNTKNEIKDLGISSNDKSTEVTNKTNLNVRIINTSQRLHNQNK